MLVQRIVAQLRQRWPKVKIVLRGDKCWKIRFQISQRPTARTKECLLDNNIEPLPQTTSYRLLGGRCVPVKALRSVPTGRLAIHSAKYPCLYATDALKSYIYPI
jgi:hypothetical protein